MKDAREHELFECPECGWTGEGVELTSDGECPKCYALLAEDWVDG